MCSGCVDRLDIGRPPPARGRPPPPGARLVGGSSSTGPRLQTKVFRKLCRVIDLKKILVKNKVGLKKNCFLMEIFQTNVNVWKKKQSFPWIFWELVAPLCPVPGGTLPSQGGLPACIPWGEEGSGTGAEGDHAEPPEGADDLSSRFHTPYTTHLNNTKSWNYWRNSVFCWGFSVGRCQNLLNSVSEPVKKE